MPLSMNLSDVALTFYCPMCNHPLVKKGSWFITAAHFRCDSCGKRVRITYPAKVELFAKYSLPAVYDHRQAAQL